MWLWKLTKWQNLPLAEHVRAKAISKDQKAIGENEHALTG